MKYPSCRTARFMCKRLCGVQSTCDSGAVTPGAGVRGAHVSGCGAGSGREARGGCRREEGYEGDRGGSRAVRRPRKGPSWLPVRTWHFVAHHPTQFPTRLY